MRQFCQLAFNKFGRKVLLKFLGSHEAIKQQWAVELIMNKGFPVFNLNQNVSADNDIAPDILEAEIKASEARLATILAKYPTPIAGLYASGTGDSPTKAIGISETPSA